MLTGQALHIQYIWYMKVEKIACGMFIVETMPTNAQFQWMLVLWIMQRIGKTSFWLLTVEV